MQPWVRCERPAWGCVDMRKLFLLSIGERLPPRRTVFDETHIVSLRAEGCYGI